MRMIWVKDLQREVPSTATLECPSCHMLLRADELREWVGCDTCRNEPGFIVRETAGD